MRILAISDVEEAWLTDRYDRERMAGVDVIVSCGDLAASYLEHIVTLANVPLLYVPGNHDTAYARHAPEGCVDIDGCIATYRGVRFMGLGGSVRYNGRVYGYTEQEMRWRATKLSLIARMSGGIDVLVTHAPAYGHGDLDDLPHRGFEAFNAVLDTLAPDTMVHGHVHLEYGRIARVSRHASGTRIVNACGSRVFEVPDAPGADPRDCSLAVRRVARGGLVG